MKTLEQIRKDLKQIQDAFRYGLKREQFGCVSYPKKFQTMAESYLTVSEQAPKRLKTVFDELYVKAKTQKVYAAERGVTEKYIQILNKRLLLFLQAAMADEQIKARRTL